MSKRECGLYVVNLPPYDQDKFINFVNKGNQARFQADKKKIFRPC